MKKIVLIIAQNGFRDEELLVPKGVFAKHGLEVKVASGSLAWASGSRGAKVMPDITLDSVKAEDFDAIVFVGGQGASGYWDDRFVHALLKQAVGLGKIVAAICIAPVILAKAGVLKAKRATVWISEAGQLKSAGAIYTGKPVEKDGLFITGSGPDSAQAFAEEIAKELLKDS